MWENNFCQLKLYLETLLTYTVCDSNKSEKYTLQVSVKVVGQKDVLRYIMNVGWKANP